MSHILAQLHQGGAIDKHRLAQDFQVNVRTIERDLGERLYGIAERTVEGRLQMTLAARATIPVSHLDTYARLVGAEHLFPDSSVHYLLEQLEAQQSAQYPLLIQSMPNEDLQGHGSQFALLQRAIEQQYECCFTYKAKHRQVQPYRLIHKNGVWYLAAVEGLQLKTFSVALIQSLQPDEARHFTPDPQHHGYINRKDDVWFTASTTEVLLRVDSETAHYFVRRAILPEQQHRKDADGSLLVTTHVSHLSQLLPVVRYWLPHVRILQPLAWHQTLVHGLEQALARWNLGSQSSLKTAPRDFPSVATLARKHSVQWFEQLFSGGTQCVPCRNPS
ncbi:YafY family protein [Acidovorax sp. 69]|uniref:helix-turn-helix transcriptional regulator n=1 Tax=Acidovorax sp. 69 TaxID=2035202 RepID=UPI0012FD4D65|nr:WYL domain-containing protein [Acidovorax sp. 69]